MATYKEAFVEFLKGENLKFRDIDERAVTLSWDSKTVASGLTVVVIFDKDNHNGVHFMCKNFCSVPDDKLIDLFAICNACNKQYRWVKFYVDDEGDVTAEDDAVLDMANVGQECIELVARIVRIVGEAYPQFMKAIYA